MPFSYSPQLSRQPMSARLRELMRVFDPVLLLFLALILFLSMITLFSASAAFDGRFYGHLRNFGIALILMWIAALVPMNVWLRIAIPIFLVGLLLLVAVALVGTIKNGARRWLDVGLLQIQPSEIMKLATPLMLAAYFHYYEDNLSKRVFLGAFVILLLPIALVLRQPDLGTAILIFATGFFVIYLAGLSWRVLIGGVIGALVCLPVAWQFLHDYQRQRVMTLFNPEADPLGQGFHIIQSMIAIGSGGFIGKGWLRGTQTHLEFIPERTTDFIFAAFSEEFGFIGGLILLLLYAILIGRALFITSVAPTLFTRLLCGSIALQFFTYAFINIGMVIGILPVVGVPLPFMSYGGTALVTLMINMGILMGVARSRYLIQT